MKRSSSYKPSRSVSHHRASPVLGVLVMVAVTVLFVAVLGVFSFGFTLDSFSSPQVSMSTELNVPNDQIRITQIGGDSLSVETTRVVVVNESGGQQLEFHSVDGTEPFRVGESMVIVTTTGSLDGWVLEPGSQTFTLQGGTTYTIGIVDTRSDTLLYRTSLTVA